MSSRSHQRGNSMRINDIEEQVPEVGKVAWDWNIIIIFVRVIALSLEPLFLYGLMINEYKKCVEIDRKLWITAMVSRSFLDITYLVLRLFTGFLGMQFRKRGRNELNAEGEDSWQTALRKYFLHRHFVFDISAFLPIPQVVISCILLDMRAMKSLKTLRILTIFIFFQYWPRVSQIYLSRKDLGSNHEILGKRLWVRGPVNFFLYIIAGHVLGAFWYCFSIQRAMACWCMACENHGGCARNSFYCDHNSDNHSFLDDICPKNLPNTELFDFGVYFDAHQSGIIESKYIPQKIFYCFCWGMRNLSSFGSNLRTSNDIGENFFALCITIFGLLLFLYFMGNLQMHMQRQTSNLIKYHEDMQADKSSKRRKTQEKIKAWMSRHKFSTEMRRQINHFMKQRFEEDEDVYVENLIPKLCPKLQNNVKRHICFDLLKKVEVLQGIDELLLLKLCHTFKPVFYNEHNYITQEGNPIDAIFLITDGVAFTYTKTSNEGEGHPERVVKDQFFGVELLQWLRQSSSKSISNLSQLPVSKKVVKTHTKVEAFVLMADDLKKIWSSKLSKVPEEELESEAASMVQRTWRHKQQQKMLHSQATPDAVLQMWHGNSHPNTDDNAGASI